MFQSSALVFDQIYVALFVLIIILVYFITNQTYENFVAYFIYTFLNKSNSNQFILKLEKINISLIFFCLYVKNFKLFVKNAFYIEINEILIKINVFGSLENSPNDLSSIFYIRFDCTTVFIYDDFISSITTHKMLSSTVNFLLKNSTFDAWYVNISICYDKQLNVYATFSAKQFLFIYGTNQVPASDNFKFQSFNLNVYLNQGKLINYNEFGFFEWFKQYKEKRLNKSYLLMSINDLNGDVHFKFRSAFVYRANLLKISSEMKDILFDNVECFLNLKTKLAFELNIDQWNKCFITIPLFIKFIKNSMNNLSFDKKRENSAFVFWLDAHSLNINVMNSMNKLFTLSFGNDKQHLNLELTQIQLDKEKTSNTRFNLQTNLLQIYSFLNKRPIVSSSKQISLYFDYKSRKIILNLEITNLISSGETILYICNLQENFNLVELCLLKLKQMRNLLIYSSENGFLKRSTPLDSLKDVNILCIVDKFIIKLVSNRGYEENEEIFINVNSLNFKLTCPPEQPLEHLDNRTAVLGIFNQLVLMNPKFPLEVKFERLVIEAMIELSEVKAQYIFTPIVLQSKQLEGNANVFEEAIYVSVTQIRNHLFYNNNICYSNQIEFILGDVFGEVKYKNLMKMVELFNFIIKYVRREIHEQTSIYALIFRDIEIIQTKKLIYKSFRLHTSIFHLNIMHNSLKFSNLIGVNLILSPICFAYCDLHCDNGKPGYLGCITDVYIRFLHLNSINWIECGSCLYNYLSAYKSYKSTNSLSIDDDASQINFLIKNDELTRRLHVFWNTLDNFSISQMSIKSTSNDEIKNFKFTSCACSGNSDFFSNSFDRKKFYSNENHVKIKPCVYKKELSLSSSLAFGQSLLSTNRYAINNYKSFKKRRSEKPGIVNKLSFDEGNDIRKEKRNLRMENELPIEDIMLTPPSVNKKIETFSLYIEYLPVIKNISNISYDPQKTNYIVSRSISRKYFRNLKSYAQSTSLKEIKNFESCFSWISEDIVPDKEFSLIESNSLLSESNISRPVSLNFLSFDSLSSNINTLVEVQISENTSLHSNITPNFENSFDISTDKSQFNNRKKKRLPVSELVLKLGNNQIFSKSRNSGKNAETIMKLNLNIRKKKHLDKKVKLEFHSNSNNNKNNNNNNFSNSKVEDYKNQLPKVRYIPNQKYPLLNFIEVDDKGVSFEEVELVEVIINSFEYIKNEQYLKVPNQKDEDIYLEMLKESKFDDSEIDELRICGETSNEFCVLYSNYIITPCGLEILNEFLKLQDLNIINKTFRTGEFCSTTKYNKTILNIFWSTYQTNVRFVNENGVESEKETKQVSSNHNFQIKLEKIEIKNRKTIGIEDLIFNLKRTNNYNINIKSTMKQFLSILLSMNISISKIFDFLNVSINQISIINPMKVIQFPGIKIDSAVKKEITEIICRIENWTITQSIPVVYLTNLLLLIYNYNRYFSILKPNGFTFKYKYKLFITNLNLILYKNLNRNATKYINIKFSTDDFKFYTSNSFEIKNLLFRLLTTLNINIEIYTRKDKSTSSNTLTIKTTGDNVISDDSTVDVISIVDEDGDEMSSEKNRGILLRVVKFKLKLEKRVLDASIKVSIKVDSDANNDEVDDTDFDYCITTIFPLIIDSKLVYSSENEYKLKLPGILCYISSKDEIMHVVELIDTSFDCNDLEHELRFIVNKSRIMSSKSIMKIIEYFKMNFLNYCEYYENDDDDDSNDNNYELYNFFNYKILLVYGELGYSYFLNKLTDNEWFYFKLYEFQIECVLMRQGFKCLKLMIEYCKNAIKEQVREIELLANLTKYNHKNENENNKSVKKISENFQLKNSSFLHVTSKYSLTFEKFDFNNWLSYSCIDNERKHAYSIKVVALFPTLSVDYKLINRVHFERINEWDLDAFFEQNMFIDTKLIQELWEQFSKTDSYRDLIKSDKNKLLKIRLNNLNLVDYNTRQMLNDIEQFLNSFFTSNPHHSFFLHFCSIEPLNIIYKFMDLFK